jgi:C-terminal peptidase prc
VHRSILLAAIAWLLAACAQRTPTPAPASTAPSPSLATLQQRTFEALWSAVNDNYVYPDFGGVDWQAVRDEYAADVAAGLSADAFADHMRAMLAELPDGAATWQTRAERLEAERRNTERFEGIGTFVAFRDEPEPRMVVLSVMPDSPAEQGGLAAHDSILAVDNLPITLEEGPRVVERIRGPAGSPVTLTVRSPEQEPRDLSFTRGSIVASDALSGGTLAGGLVGYLLFPAASADSLYENVVAALEALNDERTMQGLIIDLRIATVRGTWPLVEMMALFADGELGEVVTRDDSQPIIVTGQNLSNTQKLPLTIIVGPDTNGAPEIFAAALQAIDRAAVVGMPTRGAVGATSEFPLPDGSRVFIRTASYRAPDGRDIGQAGVQPDVLVDVDWDAVTLERDPVRRTAIEALAPPR